MKQKLLLCMFVLLCMTLSLSAQRFQITTGSASPDEKWAVVEDPAINGYVAIGNTTPGNISELWISSYTLRGVLLTSVRVSNNRPMIARDISIAPPDAAGNPTYYVTGWTQFNVAGGGAVNQMFVGRINLNGAFIWYQENPLGGNGEQKEGIAVTNAPNGDVVALGTILRGGPPGGFQVYLARFNAAGGLLWGNSYDSPGRWLPREIAQGVPSNCIGPVVTDYFVITGEVYNAAGLPGPVTFAAHYNGAGVECWRNLYPAAAPNIPTTGDAGYDIVYEPVSGNYSIAGMAMTNGGPRNGANSTPYMLTIDPAGALVTSAVYLDPPTLRPLGLYPRAVTLGSNPGEVVVAGPSYNTNQVFMGVLGNIGAPLPQFIPLNEYTGAITATANSYGQPFWFFDAQPEDVLLTNGLVTPGYLISTNNWPAGVFGGGDGHFIKTDLAGATPTGCPEKAIDNKPDDSKRQIPIPHGRVQNINFGQVPTIRNPYPVQQKDCRDDCVVTAGFTYSVTGTIVTFTDGSAGSGTLSYSWNFGDTPPGTSTTTNPVYTYPVAGTYYACLTVTNVTIWGDTCTATFCDSVRLNTCNVKASFKDSIACKTVYYTSTSTGTGPFTYNWLFDDGSTSALANPVKTYAACGPHVTRLIVCNAVCCDTITQTTNVPCCTISPAFNFCLTTTGKSVLINTNTEPSTSYTVFVNGAATAFPANGSFSLPPGNNTVCVKAQKTYCGDVCCAFVCKTIRIADTCTLNANFWFQVRSNNQVQFLNQSTPAGFTSFWQFGDPANSTSTLTNPAIFTYPGPGTYTACLTVRRINGSDTCEEKVCKTIVIDPPCNVLANFKATYCTQIPLSVTFTNMSIGGATYEWNFGDPLSGVNNTSTAISPSHNFTAPGTYIVCLKTLIDANCWSRACYTVVVSTTTTNTSCTTPPPLPAFRLFTPEVAENEMTLTDATNSGGQPKKDAAPTTAFNKQVLQRGGIILFPNPASQKVNAVFATDAPGNAEVWVFNNEGAVVYKKILAVTKGANQLAVPVAGFPAGMYHIRVKTSDKQQKGYFMVNN